MVYTVAAILLTLFVFPLQDVFAQTAVSALVKGSSSAIYYRTEGGRYVFPDSGTYFSWFNGYSAVQTISDQELAALPLKGTLTYRPGIRLVKIATDPKVYAVDTGGTLRWVQSEDMAVALYGQEWNGNVIDVPEVFFINYQIGEPIANDGDFDPETAAASAATLNVDLGLTDDPAAPRADTSVAEPNDLLPDLVPLSPYDIGYTTSGGRTLLTFTATFWNRGAGALEINTDVQNPSTDGEFEAKQRLYVNGGGYHDIAVGSLFWHAVHEHYHYEDFAEYRLEQMASISDPAPVTVFAQKTSFCLRDDTTISAPTEGQRQSKRYNGCQGGRQGVSVGWADIYPYTLPEQNFDVTGLPPGTYKMTFAVDPRGSFLEARRDNNIASTLVEIDVAARKAKVVGRLAPFEISTNTLPDGTRISIEGSDDIYLMYGNRKRKELVPGAGDTYSWPRAGVSAIPDTRFIRPTGGTDIYMINGHGWLRSIRNPIAFSSYGYPQTGVAPVGVAEFAHYRMTDLVVRSGDANVYSISERRMIGSVGSLPPAYDSLSIHVVNDVDFASYGF